LFKKLKDFTSPDDYLVKISGLTEYLNQTVPIQNFVYIRECLCKNQPIELCLITKTEEIVEKLQLLEEKVTLQFTQSHQAKSKSNSEEVFVFDRLAEPIQEGKCISHFILQEKFEIKILYLQNIALNSTTLSGDSNPTFYAEAGLYYG
jgi:hypothetical protein